VPEPIEHFDPVCPSRIAPIRVGDKWTALILTLLAERPRRFNDVRAAIAPVTNKVLAAALRDLERDGFVHRAAHLGTTRAVTYTITDLGRTLLPIIEIARAWAVDHMEAVLDAQESYDRGTEPGSTTSFRRTQRTQPNRRTTPSPEL